MQEIELSLVLSRFSDEKGVQFLFFLQPFHIVRPLEEESANSLAAMHDLAEKENFSSAKSPSSRKSSLVRKALERPLRTAPTEAFACLVHPGASPRRSFPQLVDELRNWLHEMRSYLRTDLYNYYIRLMEAERTRVEVDLSDPKLLSVQDTPLQLRLAKLTEQLGSRKNSEKAEDSLRMRLEKWCFARNMRPHLVTMLTPLAKLRCHLT